MRVTTTIVHRSLPMNKQTGPNEQANQRMLLACFRVMPDVDAFHQEQHILGDVGGMVSDTLQAPGNPDQIESLWDIMRILFHEADQFVVGGGTETVDCVVGSQYAASHVR